MKLQKVINASGKMSILGVSTMSKIVQEKMNEGASNFYIMEELHQKAGMIIANHLQTEAALITNSASSGISLSVAGLITREDVTNHHKIYRKTQFSKREIVMMKGHAIDYGVPVELMVEIGGGIVKEAGYANGCSMEQLKAAITDCTVGILFVQSHHTVQKSMPTFQEVSELAKDTGIPLIADVAAEEEWGLYSKQADVFIISGSKALEGPTSGVIAGKEKWINMIRPHMHGIGRAMKIGKEGVFGLISALETYKGNQMNEQEQKQLLSPLFLLNKYSGIHVTFIKDPKGREVFRAQIKVHKTEVGIDAINLTLQLKEGNPAIYTRDYYKNTGSFEIDPRSLSEEMVQVIVERIKDQVNQANHVHLK